MLSNQKPRNTINITFLQQQSAPQSFSKQDIMSLFSKPAQPSVCRCGIAYLYNAIPSFSGVYSILSGRLNVVIHVYSVYESKIISVYATFFSIIVSFFLNK